MSSSSKPLTVDAAKEAKNRIKLVDAIFAAGIELEFLSTIQLFSYATEKLGSVKKIEFFNKHSAQLTWLTEDLEKLHLALLWAANTDMILKYQIEKALGFAYIMLREVDKGFPFLQSAASYLISNPPTSKAEKIIKKDLCALVAKIYETKKNVLPAAHYFYNQAFESTKRRDTFEANDFMLGALRTKMKEGITPDNYQDLKNLARKIIKNCVTDLASEKDIDKDMKEQQAELKDQSLTSSAATFHVKDETILLIENQMQSAQTSLDAMREKANSFPKKPTGVKNIADKLGGKTFITSPQSQVVPSSSGTSQTARTAHAAPQKPKK